MKYILFTVLLLSGCSGTSFYAGAGHNFNGDHEGTNPVGVFEVRQEVSESTSCSYLHVSNVFDGRPFNSRNESSSDIIHCGYRFE